MAYEQKNYDHLVGMNGFGDVALKNHFTLYGGYVKNVNTIIESLKTLKANSPEYNELKRRFGWEWDGMRMHEFYFGNLTKNPKELDKKSKLFKAIESQFGSYDKWVEDYKATGMIRGAGWALLTQDRVNGNLMNHWVGEHDKGQLCDQNILVAMDVWEHVYTTDYGIKRADYINAFVNNIDWKEVEKRIL